MTARIGALLLSLLLWCGLAAQSAAVETGTHAWTIYSSSLHEGPGSEYDVIGNVSGDIAIRVDRCSSMWCKVRAEGQQGWVKQAALTFGEFPIGPFEGPKPNAPGKGGTICLYEGRDYTGPSLCRSSGWAARDLLLYHVDNRYSSVRVTGGSVTLCRDAYFHSYCQLITEDMPRLPRFLDNSVSSIRVY
jgi:hypothetical protein